jgi:4-aminobutyrate aminotransferase/(S)-3-amino-2-methylpropionate transaminase
LHREQGCEADLICLGKSLAGGYAVSACLGRAEVMAAWGDPAGEAIHTSTFLGNPPACAAALATLAEIEQLDAPTLARSRGARLRQALETLPGVTVQGQGMLLGVRIGDPGKVLMACQLLLQRGYIVLPAGAPPQLLCLTPPLGLSDAQIDGFVAALRATMEQLP